MSWLNPSIHTLAPRPTVSVGEIATADPAVISDPVTVSKSELEQKFKDMRLTVALAVGTGLLLGYVTGGYGRPFFEGPAMMRDGAEEFARLATRRLSRSEPSPPPQRAGRELERIAAQEREVVRRQAEGFASDYDERPAWLQTVVLSPKRR